MLVSLFLYNLHVIFIFIIYRTNEIGTWIFSDDLCFDLITKKIRCIEINIHTYKYKPKTLLINNNKSIQQLF